MKYLVAVSGGSDSMALLKMYEHNDIVVAHVNYGMRKEAQKETQIVIDFCVKHNIVYEIYYASKIEKGNFQQEARKLRYAFFKECCVKHGCEKVVIAHHLDDLLETYMLQKQRGSIPQHYGLKEESTVYGLTVLRPLLHYTKTELVQFCVDNHVQYQDDSSNFQLKYQRNKIRKQHILPLTKAQKQAMVKIIELENSHKEDIYAEIRDMLFQKGIYHISDKTLANIQTFIAKGKGFYQLNNEYILTKVNDQIVIAKRPMAYHYEFTTYKQFECEYFTLAREGEVGGFYVGNDDFPITIRSVEIGDFINMPYGKKKISRFFIDRKIPLLQRKQWPVVINCRGEVIFVPKLGRSKINQIKPANYFLVLKAD